MIALDQSFTFELLEVPDQWVDEKGAGSLGPTTQARRKLLDELRR